jgi:D-amino-acid dehydrogenase
MSDNPVIIIGGGLAGVTTLYELVSRGVPAMMLDAAAAPAHGASFANGGVLHPSLPDPWNNPGIGRTLFASLFDPSAPMKLHPGQVPNLIGWGVSFLRNSARARHTAIARANFELAHYSTRQTDALRQHLNLHYEQAEPGTLKLLRSDAERTQALAMADMLAEKGLRYEVLDRAALLAREPVLAQAPIGAEAGLVGAIYAPDDRVGNARMFTKALLAAAEAKGGTAHFDTKVKTLLLENGRVTGVQLADGARLDGGVVLCAGAHSARLAAQAGVSLAIRPAKGYSLTLDADPVTDRLTHPLVDPQLHIAVTPLGDKIRILGMAEFAGFDTGVAPRRLAMLRRFFEQLLPDMASELAWEERAGLGRPAPDVGGWATVYRQNHARWTVAQLRARPSGLDHGGRLSAAFGGFI